VLSHQIRQTPCLLNLLRYKHLPGFPNLKTNIYHVGVVVVTALANHARLSQDLETSLILLRQLAHKIMLPRIYSGENKAFFGHVWDVGWTRFNGHQQPRSGGRSSRCDVKSPCRSKGFCNCHAKMVECLVFRSRGKPGEAVAHLQ
jgi:hypothetical protein